MAPTEEPILGVDSHKTNMEIALQGQSRGILYEGYEKQFIQCVFEDGEVQGRNERYEFRCDASLECCGRVCCTPQTEVIPLWLMIIFIALALLLLLALLGTLAYLCAKRRPKPKKQAKNDSAAAYSSLNAKNVNGNGSGNDQRSLLVHEQDMYSTPDFGQRHNSAYRNNGDFDRYGNGYGSGGYGNGYGSGGYGRGGGGYGGGGYGDDGMSHGVHETYEESFKEEVLYEKAASTDSKEML